MLACCTEQVAVPETPLGWNLAGCFSSCCVSLSAYQKTQRKPRTALPVPYSLLVAAGGGDDTFTRIKLLGFSSSYSQRQLGSSSTQVEEASEGLDDEDGGTDRLSGSAVKTVAQSHFTSLTISLKAGF